MCPCQTWGLENRVRDQKGVLNLLHMLKTIASNAELQGLGAESTVTDHTKGNREPSIL